MREAFAGDGCRGSTGAQLGLTGPNVSGVQTTKARCVKRVVDFNVKVRVKNDGTGVDIGTGKVRMNPFNEMLAALANLPPAIVASKLEARQRSGGGDLQPH